tara:strand:- start:1256 stop:2149 length:894 start_codon:yes stop_codon:yes gene_type:complete
MAQVDIGKIKIVWKGPWNSGTAYTIDDAVSHSGSSYICIQAGTNQNPSTATAYWQVMATAGTDGTDVGATLANKEIAFKTNAGAVDGIPIGNAGEFLKVNSGATGYEYGSVSSDCVKLVSTTISSNVGDIQIQGYFDDSIYSHYILITAGLSTTNDSNNSDVSFRMQTESGGSYSDYTSSNYYELRDSATGTSGGTTGGQSGRIHSGSYANFSHNNLEADIGRGMTSFMYIWMPDTSGYSMRARNFTFSFHVATSNYYSADVSHHIDDNGVQFKGIKIYPSGGNFDAGRLTLYGFKK